MPFHPIRELIDDFRQGKMVLLVDDEDRENEGDLLLAAEFCTPQAINFMAREARGLICLTLTDEHCQRLGLEQMVPSNGSVFSTAFTVSIEAREGVSTGVSAVDRVTTIRAAISPSAQSEDIVSPGHVFPLRAQPGGVLTRRGHTEGSVDLAVLAGLRPAGVLCELMNADGTMMRGASLERYAAQHGLVALTIAELADHLQKLKDGQAETVDDEVLEMAATV